MQTATAHAIPQKCEEAPENDAFVEIALSKHFEYYSQNKRAQGRPHIMSGIITNEEKHESKIFASMLVPHKTHVSQLGMTFESVDSAEHFAMNILKSVMARILFHQIMAYDANYRFIGAPVPAVPFNYEQLIITMILLLLGPSLWYVTMCSRTVVLFGLLVLWNLYVTKTRTGSFQIVNLTVFCEQYEYYAILYILILCETFLTMLYGLTVFFVSIY